MKKILLIIMTILLSGCANITETSDLSIVSAIGIEKENNLFKVYAEIINLKNFKTNNTSSESKITIFEGTGKTLFEATRNIDKSNPNRLYFPHMKLIIVDSSIMDTNPYDIADILLRDSESTMNFFIVVTNENSPKEILETLVPFEDIPSEYIVSALKSGEKTIGNSYAVTFEKFVGDMLTKGINPSFTKIKLSENIENNNNTDMLKSTLLNTYIELGNIMVYNEEKKLVELSNEESLAFSFLKNTIGNATITLPCDDKYFTLEIIEQNTSMNFNKKNFTVSCNTELTIAVSDYSCNDNLIKKETIKKIENQTNNYIEKIITELLEKSQSYKSDFIGIGKFVNTKDKKYFDSFDDHWHSEGLLDLKLESKVKSKIQRKGHTEENTVRGKYYEK